MRVIVAAQPPGVRPQHPAPLPDYATDEQGGVQAPVVYEGRAGVQPRPGVAGRDLL